MIDENDLDHPVDVSPPMAYAGAPNDSLFDESSDGIEFQVGDISPAQENPPHPGYPVGGDEATSQASPREEQLGNAPAQGGDIPQRVPGDQVGSPRSPCPRRYPGPFPLISDPSNGFTNWVMTETCELLRKTNSLDPDRRFERTVTLLRKTSADPHFPTHVRNIVHATVTLRGTSTQAVTMIYIAIALVDTGKTCVTPFPDLPRSYFR